MNGSGRADAAARDGGSAAPAYRLDLDGLRGVAIALVVAFHVWFGRVSGGVDVFLVLSGFFFTGLLLRQAESGGRVRVAHTVRRTLRRLLPALMVVLAAVVVAAVVLRPITQWSDIADQTVASAFYYQNWHLALASADYLAADPSVSPLQHLWSMSVQGQFYLAITALLALLAWACRRAGRPGVLRPVLLVLLGVLAGASFVYAMHGTRAHQGWNYYDSFARAWELLAGALLALAAPWLSPPRRLRAALAVAGLAIVAVCGKLVYGAAVFPGPAALIPVGAAAALVLAGNNLEPSARPWLLRCLATRPVVELGALAYALYLWHWPILIYYLAERHEPDAGPVAGLTVIAVSLLLAYATRHLVEEPLRLRRRTAAPHPAIGAQTRTPAHYRRRIGVAVSVLGAIAIGLSTSWHVAMGASAPRPPAALDPHLYPGAEALASGATVPHVRMRPTVLEAPSDAPQSTADGCISDFSTTTLITCDYGDVDAKRTIAVVGSSHAEHWLPALQILAREHGFRIRVMLKMGCPLTVSDDVSYKGEAIPDCRNWSRQVIDRLGRERPEWVFTTGTRPRAGAGDETPQDYLDVWSQLTGRGLNVLAMRDTPWLRHNGVRYRATDCLASGGTSRSCGLPRDFALDPVNPEAAPAARFPTVFPIDLTNAVCAADVCPVSAGNILIYHDEHHLTAAYSRSLAPALSRALQPILGWW
ncbi:acyltransferase [Nocardia sp. NEAU-G5]|uniref:Acyltransferase n=1 Tax=Nocardia albiluteola TaxID=2842303 RepID=A0ABS6AYP9_9NOCA|nr:acyltransferase family protein [Nocardia albiluteola]MBU3062143.1 acyltransferase [Nocardia albiluteola]